MRSNRVKAIAAVAVAAAAVAGGLSTAAAQAAPRPNSSSSSSITLATGSSASAWSTGTAAGSIRYGDAISFATTIGIRPSKSTTVFIRLACFQGSTPVFWADGSTTNTFVLTDLDLAVWDGGEARCAADLVAATAGSNRVNYDVLATTGLFNVGAA